MEYNKCHNIYDMVTLTEWTEKLPDVQILFIENDDVERTMCYDSESLLTWLSDDNNVFARWDPSTGEMDEMGYWGEPNMDFLYMKLYTNEYIIMDEVFDKLIAFINEEFIKVTVKYTDTVRIGNLRGDYHIGDLHGQSPGYRVYKITKIEMLDVNVSLLEYFSQFGIRTLDKLVKILGSVNNKRVLGNIPNQDIKIVGRKVNDTYIISVEQSDLSTDIMGFNIEGSVITNIRIWDDLIIYKRVLDKGRKGAHDVENIGLVPQRLAFKDDVELLEEFLSQFDIKSTEDFIEYYVLVEPEYIMADGLPIFPRIILLHNDDISVEMLLRKITKKVYDMNIVEIYSDKIESYLAAEFKITDGYINIKNIYELKQY